MRTRQSHVGVLWPGLGLLGSLAAATAATGLLARRPTRWWWQISLGTHGVQWHVFWAGVLVLCLAWLGLGWRVHRRPGTRPFTLVLVGALWATPLFLGPVLFSLDMYSYLVQGAVLAHGLNPYHSAAAALHDPRLLVGVSGTWTHTTTPYGPVFIAIASAASRVAGLHSTQGVMLLRIPELVGLGLLARYVPRLARVMGADPARATWLVVISPLSLLYLVAGGHNDALMAGLMVAGVALALERRPLAGIALCALAATIKLPAAAAVVMIGICWWRAEPARWRQILTEGGLVTAAVVVAAGMLTGVGLSWISGSLFSTPATARMALTPATAVSVSLWEITHHFGAGVEQAAAAWENAATLAGFVLVGLFAIALCLRVRFATLPRYLGLVLIAAALGGPAAWPWYLSWGIVLLGADRLAQRSPWLPFVTVVGVLPVMAGGQVAIALPDSLAMVAFYAVVLGVAALRPAVRRRLRGQELPGAVAGLRPRSRHAVRLPRPSVSVTPMAHGPASEPSSIAASKLPG